MVFILLELFSAGIFIEKFRDDGPALRPPSACTGEICFDAQVMQMWRQAVAT
jgi:hypothetical protein